MRRLAVLLLLALPTAAMAQPPLVAAVIYAVAAYAGYITIAQAIIMIAVTVYGAVSSREASRRARNQARDAYNNSLQDRTVNLMSTEAPWQIIYGEAVVGGVVSTVLTSGDKDQYKHVVIVWAAHECDAITDLRINGVSVGALDADGFPTSGKFLANGTSTDTLTVTLDAAGHATLPNHSPFGGYWTRTLGWQRVVSIREAVAEGASSAVLGTNDATVSGLGGLSLAVNAEHVAAWAGKTVLVTVDAGVGAANVRVRHYLGTLTQTADAPTIADCPGDWTSNDRGLGLCYSIVRLDLNEPEFQAGPPQFTARIRGRKVLDRRTGVTAWSNNNALCIDDFLQAEWGKQALASQIVTASVQASANVCDEGLALHPGEKRYTCNGAFTTDRNPDTTLNELCQSMAGFVTYTGAWHLQAGAWTAPVMDLGDAENAGAVEGIAEDSAVEAFNGVRGQFYDPDRFDQLTDYTPYKNVSYVEEDGEELWAPLNFPFTNKGWRAANLARIHTERSRGMTLVVPCKRVALKLRVGQRVRYSNSLLGISLATFRVVKRPYRLGQPVQVTLARDLESYYDELDDPPTTLDSPSVFVTSPFVVAPVSGLAATSGTATLIMQTDGTVLSRVKVTWDASTDALVQQGGALQVEYRRDEHTAWQRAPEASGEGTETFVVGLEERQVYVVRARWRNSIGVTGDWRSTWVYHLGKQELPAGVEGLTADVVPGALRIRRTPSAEADYASTLYRYGASWGAGTAIPGTSDKSGCIWPWPAPGTYTIWAADVDASGNVGTPVSYGPVSVTAAALAPASSTLGIKINHGSFTDTNYNECWIHGRDASGAAVDAPGTILVDGVATSIPNGLLFGSQGPAASYIGWTRDGSGFAIAGGPTNHPYAAVRCAAGQWQYDNNNTWVNFTPTDVHRIIGTVESGAPDVGAPGSPPGITAASIWAAASTLGALETSAAAAYALAAAQSTVTLINDGGMTITGNTVQKTGGGPAWTASVRSRDSYSGGAFVSWVQPDISYSFGMGLNTDPTTNVSYDSIDAWLYNNGAELYVYNNGTVQNGGASVGAVASGDVLAVTYDGSYYRYYRNGAVLFSQAATVTAPLFLDSSFDTVGGRATNVQFGPLTSNAWASIGGRPKSYLIRSVGYRPVLDGTSPYAAGLYDAENGLGLQGIGPMYQVMTINRSTLALTNLGTFNTLAGGGNPAAMAAALNGIPTGTHIVIVATYDEPRGNRLSGGLLAAMLRHGASRSVFGSSDFKFRAAYIMVGVSGCGEGNGAEVYAGAVDDDANAFCELAFSLFNGSLTVSGTTSGARTLLDYGYTGSLDATRNSVTYSASAPSSPADGDIWIDTSVSPRTIRMRLGGAWQLAGTYVNGTAQLTDDAQLGLTAVWNGITGSGKPADNATRNVVTYSGSAPSSPADGDLWVDTAGTYAVFKLRSGGVWITGANALSAYNNLSGKPVALADINTTESSKLSGIADNATRNQVYFQDGDPGSVPDGSIWISSTTAWQRVGGTWQPYVGNASVDTAQLASTAITELASASDSVSYSNIS